MPLDSIQAKAMEIFSAQKSLALLGGAGSRKSFLLQRVLGEARKEKGGFPFVVACGLSNNTASKLEGHTIHALLGAPPHWRFSKSELWNIVKNRCYRMDFLRRVQVLIIDEVFVLTAAVFDSIDYVFRKLATSDEKESIPFGGRQVVVAGDPFQLQAIPQAPNTKQNGRNLQIRPRMSDMRRIENEDLPAYKSRAWFLTFGGFGSGYVLSLYRNHRQVEDKPFFELLQRMGIGICTISDIEEINKTGEISGKAPATHTELCLHKRTVYLRNYNTLSSMSGKLYCSEAVDNFLADETPQSRRCLEDAAPSIIQFKVGSAMLLTRPVGDLSPGSRITIVHVFTTTETYSQNPTSKHRIGNVIFLANSEHYEAGPFSFSIRRHDTKIIASRKQLPFIPAYAITVHKSQGLSLASVAIDFNEITNWKPEGMVYVALSRCRTLKGLWVRGLTSGHVKVSNYAISFLQNIISLRSHYPNRILVSDELPQNLMHQRNTIQDRLPLTEVCKAAAQSNT